MRSLTALLVTILGTLSVQGALFENNSSVTAVDLVNGATLQQEERTQIDVSEIPSTITEAIAKGEYKDWFITNAYVLKPSGNYEVELAKGDEVLVLKYDAEGNLVE